MYLRRKLAQLSMVVFILVVFYLLRTQKLQKRFGKIIGRRSFIIDHEKAQFLKDGRSFQFISGTFHYFRALPETWQRKLRTMRAAGLNTVSTSVEWSLHNPKDNVYDFRGIANIIEFIKLAAKEGLLVILRPGPYICADRDFGGFPHWLLNKYPRIQVRTFDKDYIYEVQKWFKVLMPKIKPYLYGNGGPIIMVQIENEYGLISHPNEEYINWLRNETGTYVKDAAVLFTADPPNVVQNGRVKGVLATINFGLPKYVQRLDSYWSRLKKVQPNAPFVNAEFNTGWLTHWQEDIERAATQKVIENFAKMLKSGVNVNFYVFYGGTNFGFTASASNGGIGHYNPDMTSYDYDAPMDESGDITEKFLGIRNVIKNYKKLTLPPLPEKSKKIKLKDIKMETISSIIQKETIARLSTFQHHSLLPKTFEELNQRSGFILYETRLPLSHKDPTLLTVEHIRDRGYVFVNRRFVGILSRENAMNSIPIRLGLGNRLQILVENEGRMSQFEYTDFKGILGQISFGQKNLNSNNWTMSGLPFDNYAEIDRYVRKFYRQPIMKNKILTGPVLLHAEFLIQKNCFDTYLDSTGWGKGFVFINGFNIGRYWGSVGPQLTLYVPRQILKSGSNRITIVELEKLPKDKIIRFSKVPKLNGSSKTIITYN